MEQDTSKLDEIQTSRDALRERLRAKAEEIVAAVEALPEPKTFLEAERAARMVILADKMVERVFSEPKVVKPRPHKAQVHRTVAAPIVMDSAVTPPPPSFACAGEDEEETPLSKTYLKLEQLAAKITALDVEFNGQKSTQRSP